MAGMGCGSPIQEPALILNNYLIKNSYRRAFLGDPEHA
jgi:hypothetical protein